MQELKQFYSTSPEEGPNFQHLHIYADIFSQLIECSLTFHFVFEKIKVLLPYVWQLSTTVCTVENSNY